MPSASPPLSSRPRGNGNPPCQAARPLWPLSDPTPGTENLSPLARLADLGLALASAWAPGLLLEPGQAPPSTQPLPQSHPAGR